MIALYNLLVISALVLKGRRNFFSFGGGWVGKEIGGMCKFSPYSLFCSLMI